MIKYDVIESGNNRWLGTYMAKNSFEARKIAAKENGLQLLDVYACVAKE